MISTYRNKVQQFISARVLMIDDDRSICDLVSKYLEHQGHTVETISSGIELDEYLQNPYDAILLDVSLPDVNGFELLERISAVRPEVAVVMLTAASEAEFVVESMRRGAFDYLTKPLDMQRLQIVIRNAAAHTRLRLESDGLRAAMIRGDGGPDLVCASQGMSEVISLVERVAQTQVPVLVHGESGSGKGVVSYRIHARSSRKSLPFVHMNCTALPAEELEAELFGSEGHQGKAELAKGGTLFLDEVGELGLDLQGRLLRALIEKKIDARIIVATSSHLPTEVSRGRFRADLFYRLNVFSINVPPLRDRRDDIPALIRFALSRFAAKEKCPPFKVSDEAMQTLRAYNWPGNVRELNNIVEQAIIACDNGQIMIEHLPETVRNTSIDEDLNQSNGLLAESDANNYSKVRPLKDLEREMMVAALRETRGNVSEAARRLGIGRATFYRRAQRHGLTRDDGFPG